MRVTIMMWNPPWTISLVMPFSLLEYSKARTLWALMQMALIMVSAGWLWHFYGGRASTASLAALAALLFPASLIALGIGQISPIVLCGLCGFLYFERRGQYFLAGIAASITLVKPHLVYLIWAAIFLGCIHRRQWGVLAGALIAIASLMAAPLLLNPGICAQYFAAMRTYPPDYYLSPTLGTLARFVLGWERWWPQFLPNLIGIAWLVWYWVPRRHNWKWKDHLPVILVASVITSAFGWLFDQVVFLIPAIQLLARPVRKGRPSLATAAKMIMVLACMLSIILWPLSSGPIEQPRNKQLAHTAMSRALGTPNQFWHIVVAPIFLLGFLIGWKHYHPIARDPKYLPSPERSDAQPRE